MANILVVDDENAMLQLIKRILEKDAHIVTLQANAKAVLDMDFRRYDLILLDVMMPDVNGFELCNQIRSRVDCPIIFLTAKTQESDIVRGLGIGGDDYITKPFGTNELLARVNAHLRRDTREKKYAVSISGILFHINAKEAEVNGNKECTDYIEGSVIQMQDYVETLIEMTKTKENFPFCRQNVKVSSLLQEIHTQAKGLCVVKNVHLEWNQNFNQECISVDREQLIRAFVNILSNAVEYTPAKGTIFFDVNEKDNAILFSITDTGSGFSSEALKRATEQFYMDDQSRNSKSHYGIGLYVVNSIVTQHGGQLILSNSEKTGGAQVTISIPY